MAVVVYVHQLRLEKKVHQLRLVLYLFVGFVFLAVVGYTAVCVGSLTRAF